MYTNVKLVWDVCPADVACFYVTLLASLNLSAVYSMITNNFQVNIIFVKYVNFRANKTCAIILSQVLNIIAGFML